jgi:hypothetical protein
MYKLPDRINPLAAIGIGQIDHQIEGVIREIQATYKAHMRAPKEERVATLLSWALKLRDHPKVESEDDAFEAIVDQHGMIWTRFVSEADFGWTHRDPDTLLNKYSVRFCLRQRIKDFIAHPLVLDPDADSELVLDIGEVKQQGAVVSFEPVSSMLQQELGVPHLLKNYEVSSYPSPKS